MNKQSVAVVAAVAFCAGLLIGDAYRLSFPPPSAIEEHRRLLEMQAGQIKDLQEAYGRIAETLSATRH